MAVNILVNHQSSGCQTQLALCSLLLQINSVPTLPRIQAKLRLLIHCYCGISEDTWNV